MPPLDVVLVLDHLRLAIRYNLCILSLCVSREENMNSPLLISSVFLSESVCLMKNTESSIHPAGFIGQIWNRVCKALTFSVDWGEFKTEVEKQCSCTLSPWVFMILRVWSDAVWALIITRATEAFEGMPSTLDCFICAPLASEYVVFSTVPLRTWKA